MSVGVGAGVWYTNKIQLPTFTNWITQQQKKALFPIALINRIAKKDLTINCLI